MSNQSIWYLENMNMSDIFCKNKLQQSNQELIEKSYKKGEYIYEANETADKIFLIKTGKVKIISVGESGKEIVKTILSLSLIHISEPTRPY